MDTTTIVLGAGLIVMAIVIAILFALNRAKWSDETKQAVITQMYAVAKSIHAARADGKITQEELRTIFQATLGVIAAMRGVEIGEVDNEFPKVETPSDNEFPGKLPGNYYPELLRISTGSIETNGGKVGPAENEVTIGRKGLLYAAVTCDVSCGYTIRCYLDGKTTAEANMITGGIAGPGVGRENAVIISWPGTNGYPSGTHEALFVLSDQNDVGCDSYSMTLCVE